MESITTGKLQERGQITIPFKMRSRLGLKPGKEVIMILIGNELIIRPETNIMEKIGMLGKERGVKTVKELTAKYRGF